MDAQEQGRGVTQNPDADSDKDTAAQVVSAARRRALKAGLVAVPMMLTLRSNPVFGADPCIAGSLTLSAAQSHGVELPPCEEETKPGQGNGALGQPSNNSFGQPGNGASQPGIRGQGGSDIDSGRGVAKDDFGKSGNDNRTRPSGR